MIKTMIVLMMFGWAGCTQQEDAVIPKYDVTYIDGLSDGSRPACLYSSEYEVCRMRGHKYGRWNIYDPGSIACKWCGYYIIRSDSSEVTE